MEITKYLPLSSEEQSMLDMHSFYNVLSVVTSLCYLIEFDLGIEGVLNENTKLIHNLKDVLKSRFQLIKNLKNYPNLKSSFFEKFEKTLEKYPEALTNKDIIEERENIYSVFEVIDKRVGEMNKRLQNDGGWKVFNVEEIEDSFIQFFKAVEKNAKGKYRIIYKDTEQLPNDYLVHSNINSLDNTTIFCHDKVIDIMRDLMANARKYTPFGGQIELVYAFQNADLNIKPNRFSPEIFITKFNVHHIQVGFLQNFNYDEDLVPFGGMSAGMAIFSPQNIDSVDSGYDPGSRTKFEFGFTGGAKYFFTDRIGIRLQAQLLIPIEWGGVYYSSGGSVFTTGGSLLQLNFTGGLIVRLG